MSSWLRVATTQYRHAKRVRIIAFLSSLSGTRELVSGNCRIFYAFQLILICPRAPSDEASKHSDLLCATLSYKHDAWAWDWALQATFFLKSPTLNSLEPGHLLHLQQQLLLCLCLPAQLRVSCLQLCLDLRTLAGNLQGSSHGSCSQSRRPWLFMFLLDYSRSKRAIHKSLFLRRVDNSPPPSSLGSVSSRLTPVVSICSPIPPFSSSSPPCPPRSPLAP